MKPELKDALAAYLLSLADDEMILGHRNSEWCGHAPILEEDIAFANIALDEQGHAALWYGLLGDLLGKDRETYPDELVYRRDASEFRCAQFVELPKGDWAFSMLRQYLFDVLEKVQIDELLKSGYQPIAEVAAKMRAEEIYHLRHTAMWVRRLGLGTDESNRRMQKACDELWPYALHVFDPAPGAELLVEADYIPDAAALRAEWLKIVILYLRDSGLHVPDVKAVLPNSREQHSEYLAPLLEDLQQIARQYPDVRW